MNAAAADSEFALARPVEHADHAYVLGEDGSIVAVSDDLLDRLGYTADDIVGTSYLDVVAPTHLGTSRRQFERKVLDRETVTEEITEILARDGRPVLLAIRSFRLRQPHGGVLLVGVAVEIADPRLVELASGDAAIGIGDDMRVIGWNAAAEHLLGLSASEAIGKPCWEVFRASDEFGDPICGPDCWLADRMREGGEPARLPVRVSTPHGERRRTLSTVSTQFGTGRLMMHLLPTGRRSRDAGMVLTERQHEILILLDEGLTTAEIAKRLVLSTTTVRNHVQAILGGLRCHSRLEAVAEGRRLGLL